MSKDLDVGQPTRVFCVTVVGFLPRLKPWASALLPL